MTEPKKRMYASTTLGLPPLKMVLVHAQNEAQNATAGASARGVPAQAEEEEGLLDKEKVVRRIIKVLEEME